MEKIRTVFSPFLSNMHDKLTQKISGSGKFSTGETFCILNVLIGYIYMVLNICMKI